MIMSICKCTISCGKLNLALCQIQMMIIVKKMLILFNQKVIITDSFSNSVIDIQAEHDGFIYYTKESL